MGIGILAARLTPAETAGMDSGKTQNPRHTQLSRSVAKSESNASVGAGSTNSHDSVGAIGSHPYGTLQVHHAGDTSPLARSVAADEDMPALDDVVESEQHQDVARPEGQLRPETLRHAKGGGDVVLVLDLPEVFVVGYDSISFTAKHFGGVRDIPAGAHFIWVAHPNGISSRCGVWIMSSGVDGVHVMQWDRYNEVLCESSSAEARIQANNVDSIHSKLVAYRDPESVNSTEKSQHDAKANLGIWGQLTSAVTETMLNRVTGQPHGDWFMHTGDRAKGSTLISAEVELDRRVSSAYLHDRELTFVFSQMSKTYSVDHTGSDRTLEATDATPYIMSLLGDSTGLTEDDILGEFQFAFIVGVHLGNDSCVQQWWHMLLHLVLKAYLLPKRQPVLAASLLRTLGQQIFYSVHKTETSVLDQSDSQSRDLRLALIIYKRRLDELISGTSTPDELSVATAFAKVEAIVALSPLDWDLRSDNYVRKGKVMMEDGEEVDVEMAELEAEDERGEWAPEVVELDESGREKGLVSWTV